jgi:hypothetical protein
MESCLALTITFFSRPQMAIQPKLLAVMRSFDGWIRLEI